MPETNVDAFLEIIDSKGAAIAGESLDKQHPNLLQIANFSFGTEMVHSASTGTASPDAVLRRSLRSSASSSAS